VVNLREGGSTPNPYPGLPGARIRSGSASRRSSGALEVVVVVVVVFVVVGAVGVVVRVDRTTPARPSSAAVRAEHPRERQVTLQ